ncbi:lipocalin family protein [Chryseobacterium sp. RG1]|uniref:Lipocalin family protein n=1 Tax=Chryseobacterium tagetis TaxID=2801334 RepID=A0ABS8A7F6_9FLAO|nr:lipocalin family protein [Chryseobacterium tagetis]MCA6069248.1 lipocalin family protein [Chryseobacterium tagetis]
MKRIIYLLMYCLVLVNCQSQNKNLNLDKKNIEQSSDPKKYLLGNWVLIERNYWDGNIKKSYPLHDCEKKYSLSFVKENADFFLTKNYVDGKNCDVKSNSGKISVSINEGFFSYLDLDLKRKESYKMISESKLSLIYNEILEGKVREIEDVYERF